MLHMRSIESGLEIHQTHMLSKETGWEPFRDIIPSLQHKRKQKASGAWGIAQFLSAMFLAPKPTLSREMREVCQPAEWGIHSGRCERLPGAAELMQEEKLVHAQIAYRWRESAMPSILKLKQVQSRGGRSDCEKQRQGKSLYNDQIRRGQKCNRFLWPKW